MAAVGRSGFFLFKRILLLRKQSLDWTNVITTYNGSFHTVYIETL